MQNKRGQGLSTSAIVLIILGVVVLAVLIVGFTVGWSNLAPWLSKDNVDSIQTQCSVACSTMSEFDFCTKTRDLTVNGHDYTGNCSAFAKYPTFTSLNLGIDDCPDITC